MPLSSVVGAQSIVKPGVCTSSTRPASPYTGQMIYDTTTSTALVWNSTAWVGVGGLVLVKSQTIGSAVSVVNMTSVFSSVYDNYRVVINTSGSADVALSAQLGTGSATTSNYKSYLQTSFATWTTGAAATATQTSGLFGGYAAAGVNVCSFDVMCPNLAQNTFSIGNYATINNGGFTAGIQTDSTQFTSLHILPSSGTITGGTILVYGYLKA